MRVAIVGGKGGTGKTIIAVNIACILSKRGRTLLVDADVDNPCTLNTVRSISSKLLEERYITRFKPLIDQAKCDLCGKCVQVCPEHALAIIPGVKVMLIETLCAGCGCCILTCDRGAIREEQVREAVVRYYKTELFDILIGELLPGHRRSYIVITKLIEDNRELLDKYDYVVIDSPPGTGAGVFAILRNIDKIVVVTEPTPLGIADFTKLLKLLKEKFSNKKIIVVINKSTLSEELCKKIEDICLKDSLTCIRIPYSRVVIESYVKGTPVLMYDKKDSDVISALNTIVEEIVTD